MCLHLSPYANAFECLLDNSLNTRPLPDAKKRVGAMFTMWKLGFDGLLMKGCKDVMNWKEIPIIKPYELRSRESKIICTSLFNYY